MVRDTLGTPVLDNTYPQQTEVVSAGVAYVMSSMLESVINEGTGYPNAVIGRPAAGKTGTTSSFRDAWFVGFTPDLVAAVWIGNDDYTRMNESYGGNIPARIWARFMKAALAKTPKHDFVLPVGEVHKVKLCGSGKTEVFLSGTEPLHGTCGEADQTPAPRSRDKSAYVPDAAAAAVAVPAAPVAKAYVPKTPPSIAPMTTPPNTIGDGQNQVPLQPEPTTAP
jgi:penicillin-binding protein 1A